MPRFNVHVGFSLITEIEPEYFNLNIEDAAGVSDFEDGSYWSRKTIESDGGSYTFKVEAEDEDDVRNLVHEFIREDMEVEDNDSVTWTAQNVEVEVEEVEEPMDKEKAKAIIRQWLMDMDGSTVPVEVRVAIVFILETL